MPKTYDLAVKVGSYEVDGKTKNRYLNIGAVFSGDKGNYILLNKTFNPAGVQDERGGQSIIVSMFEPKSNNSSEEKPASATENWAE